MGGFTLYQARMLTCDIKQLGGRVRVSRQEAMEIVARRKAKRGG